MTLMLNMGPKIKYLRDYYKNFLFYLWHLIRAVPGKKVLGGWNGT